MTLRPEDVNKKGEEKDGGVKRVPDIPEKNSTPFTMEISRVSDNRPCAILHCNRETLAVTHDICHHYGDKRAWMRPCGSIWPIL
ncbi:hypothetical protein CDAR_451101 [Caerostris darwini]|uniref:Uncharacterized protein n=1 Tax=Caerostris darwini TaxID=1538125 RepID=A0AAV4PRI1_9ARAC|nr:hypothetical protein CDAR_451101 [Caerostris darwini]